MERNSLLCATVPDGEERRDARVGRSLTLLSPRFRHDGQPHPAHAAHCNLLDCRARVLKNGCKRGLRPMTGLDEERPARGRRPVLPHVAAWSGMLAAALLAGCAMPAGPIHVAAVSHKYEEPTTGSLIAGNDGGSERVGKTGDPSFYQPQNSPAAAGTAQTFFGR